MKSFKFALLAAGVTLGALATSAEAATCLTSDVSGASSCSGYVAGNIFSNGGGNPNTVTSMLSGLGFDASGIDFGALYSNTGLKLSNLGGATTLSFGGAPELFGETFIGIHWGGQGGGQSAIYKLDLTNPASVIEILGKNPGGTSNAVLFSTTPFNPGGVPEPATWALMIMGFGLVGATMRHRRAKVSFA
ncbi:PEPxxWA-CTERM sorting domain-containing protein [Sphingomonas lycopersici]|uniref:PEPxxWA-CTERM sorting domain-containing protein n=1 Tax=Sphingomonas lycopersici TaxID=2951807 RepID=A0AA41ZAL6_9SPHN|nr:PEPxxWA-CTERM sorting domain-containing protein [Sphingomonas lycopersici]MCW6533171.1 PEPxxWA-CTERM sorting domain-containing protein [Sphingomonas lycopersici]